MFATQREDKLRERAGGSHCRCVCYTERRQTKREGREVANAAMFATQREEQTKREGREVAIADVFAGKRGQSGANSKNNTRSVPLHLKF